MKCEGAKELFSEYMEGRIDYALTATLRHHIEECPSCKRDFDLFKQTYASLEALPEVMPPVNFRHEVVMRAARMQHESSKVATKRESQWSFGSVLNWLVPARTIAITAAAAALALVLFKGPGLYEGLKAGFSPAVPVGQSLDTSGPNVVPSGTPSELDPGLKEAWRSRKIGRNSLWISVDSKQGESTMMYRVLLSINQDSLSEGETCARVFSRVWVLPEKESSPTSENATELWHGNILADSPLVVPVVQPVNLLVTWRFRGRDFAQIVYLPSRDGDAYARDVYDFSVGSGSYSRNRGDLYASLESLAEEYGVVVIANACITDKSPGVAFGASGLEEALQAALKPADMDWLSADRAVYIDRKL